MSLVSKKKAMRKGLQSATKTKQVPKVKNIGLAEQIAEAERLFRLLENPELLRK